MFEELTVAWWWVAVAFFCGGGFGIFTICLCIASGRADDEIEDIVKRVGGHS